MRKFFFTLLVCLFALSAIPSCAPTDSLEDVIEESDLEVVATTDDEEDKVAKPGASN